MELHVQLFIAFSLFGWGFALSCGDKAERAVTIVMIVGALLSILALPVSMAMRFEHLERGVAVADTVMLLGLVDVAHRYKKAWLLWMAALQFLTLLSHFPILMRRLITPEGYVITSALWSWLMMILLVGATAITWRTGRRGRTSGFSDAYWDR